MDVLQFTRSGAPAMFDNTTAYSNSDTREFMAVSQLTMVNQREPFNFNYSVEGRYAVGEADLTTPKSQRTMVSLVLRTPTVYEQSPVISAAVWAHGPGYGNIGSTSMKLVISREDTASTQTVSCGSTSLYGGMRCTGELDAGWFDGSTSAQIGRAHV